MAKKMNINYDKYLKVCQDAALDDKVFATFKSHQDYTAILEHVTKQYGEEYWHEILNIEPALEEEMNEFMGNDVIGNPAKHSIGGYSVSPTTLRYVKVLADLRSLFGSLDELDIIEIGGGYGGQCKIIYDLYKPKSYTIVDLPEVLALSKKYLSKHNIDVITRVPHDTCDKHYDLFISNYAFTEIDREYQQFYADHIIKYCDKGYMTCNYVGLRNREESFVEEEIFGLKPNFLVLPEIPLTAPNNLIYTWQ